MTDALLRYVNPQGKLPEVKATGDLLVIGSAKCVWLDLRSSPLEEGKFDRMGVNNIMADATFPLQHGVTLHPEKLPGWRFGQDFQREKHGWPRMMVHSNHDVWPQHLVDYVWPIHRDGGTSGIMGAIVALLLGYDRIILAGIPGDFSPRYFEPPWFLHKHFSKSEVFKEWITLHDEVPMAREKIRSLSGKTRELFGAP